VAVGRAFWSLFFGLFIAVLSSIGLFYTNQTALRALAIVGIALGSLAAPFQAFHDMRRQRDEAYGDRPFFNTSGLRITNMLSTQNWTVRSGSLWPPSGSPLVIRAIAESAVPPQQGIEIQSKLADGARDLLAKSTLDEWLNRLNHQSNADTTPWTLTFCDSRRVVIEREHTTHPNGGSDVWVRCTLQSHGFFGAQILIDVITSDIEGHTVPYRPNLEELFGLLDAVTDTIVVDLGPKIFPELANQKRSHRNLASRRRPELDLIGPNFEVMTQTKGLGEVIDLPEFKRLPEYQRQNAMFIETPEHSSLTDLDSRHELFRQGIRRFLRDCQYHDFEGYVDQLGKNRR
jgi:hypothetical protein